MLIRFSKKILDNNPDSIILNLYAGVTCMSIDKAAEATQYLENVINSHNPNFTESAEWYLAILPLKSGDKTLAKERLTIIRNKSGHQYREKAKHIFRKLH